MSYKVSNESHSSSLMNNEIYKVVKKALSEDPAPISFINAAAIIDCMFESRDRSDKEYINIFMLYRNFFRDLEQYENCESFNEITSNDENCYLKSGWSVGLTEEFIKSIKDVSAKYEKTLIDAIRSLCQKPVNSLGNKIKPFSNSQIELWEYNIDNYRLLYKLIETNTTINLLYLGSISIVKVFFKK